MLKQVASGELDAQEAAKQALGKHIGFNEDVVNSANVEMFDHEELQKQAQKYAGDFKNQASQYHEDFKNQAKKYNE